MSIPTEVVEDILSRLPVECLLRFRCVCPPWRDLIDSPHFVKLHLNRSIQTETNLNLLLKNQIGKPSLHAAKFEPSSILSLEAKELDHHPLRNPKYGVPEIWDTCNGLICLGSVLREGVISVGKDFQTTIVIWNPSTRTSVTLPFTDFELEKEESISDYRRNCGYALGYDSVADDYKVAMIMEMLRIGGTRVRVYSIKVFSLKQHSWHSVKGFNNQLHCMKIEPGRSPSNVIHWILPSLDPDKTGEIVAFDLHSETCRIVPGPRFEDTQCDLSLEPFRGSICVVGLNRLGVIGVWVMREYGVQESWTKLLSYKPKFTRPFYVPNKSGGGVFIQRDGELIWVDTGDRKSCYDMEIESDHDKVKNIEIRGLQNFEKVDAYIGSLVPLGPFSKLNDEMKPKEKMKKNEMASFLSKGFKLKL